MLKLGPRRSSIPFEPPFEKPEIARFVRRVVDRVGEVNPAQKKQFRKGMVSESCAACALKPDKKLLRLPFGWKEANPVESFAANQKRSRIARGDHAPIEFHRIRRIDFGAQKILHVAEDHVRLRMRGQICALQFQFSLDP